MVANTHGRIARTMIMSMAIVIAYILPMFV
jgi:hypothetical protein